MELNRTAFGPDERSYTDSLRMELLIIAIVLTATDLDAAGSQVEGPQNTVSVVGSNVTMKCSSPTRNCSGIDWLKYVTGTSPMTIFKGPRTILNVIGRDRYSFDNSSGCNLVIKNVQLIDAGRFICSAIFSSTQTSKSANLIILESLPRCTINASEDSIAGGDGVQLKCGVTYNGINRVSMDWKGVTDAPAAVKNGNTIIQTYSVVASEPEIPSFTCVTSFAYETVDNGVPIVGLATNIPNANCSTPVIKVLYPVMNVTLSPSYSNYPPGTVITCAAKGHPSPTFKWQETINDDTWMDLQNQNGSQFSGHDTKCRRYRCIALNYLKRQAYAATSHAFQIYSKVVAGSQLDGPENTVSFHGANVILKCSSSSRNCSGIEWLKYNPTSNPITIFNPRLGINTAYYNRYRYRVENSSGCALVIRNVDMRDAGRFVCRALISSRTVEKAAYLTISEIQQPICTINASPDNILEGDTVSLTCDVAYNGRLKVSISWKGVEYAQAAVESANSVSQSFYVVVSAPEIPSFTCIASFASVDYNRTSLSCLATNVPNATCETSVIKVLYSVRNVALLPSLFNYSPGSVINCTAKGRPLPTFKWQEFDNNGTTWIDIQNQNGSEFTITNVSSNRYRCVAMNVVRGISYNETSHEFLIGNTESAATLNILHFGLPLMVWVGCGSGATGLILLIILLVICCCVRACPCYKCCHSGNKSNENMREEHTLREDSDIYSNVNQAEDQACDYACLEADREVDEYLPLEQTKRTKPEMKKTKQ